MQHYSAGSYEIVEDDDGEYYLADEVDTAMQDKDAEIAELLKDVTFLQSSKDVIHDKLRAEVERRSEMHECAMAERDDCILDWSDTKAERDRLAAEVERLTAERDEWRGHVSSANHERNAARSDAREAAQIPSLMAAIDRLTADLATARAETAMAFEVAAERLREYCKSQMFKETLTDQLCFVVEKKTPAAAKAALAARDKAKDDRIAELEAAATNAKMYLESGFINCPRCAEEVPTKDNDAEYALRNALAAPQSEVSHDRT